jgi:hypothetical protein
MVRPSIPCIVRAVIRTTTDSNGDSNSSDRRQRRTLGRSAATGDMSGLKTDGRPAAPLHRAPGPRSDEKHGAQLCWPGVSAITAMRSARFRIRVAQRAAALVVVAAGIFTLWYRQTYNVWPVQEASTRIHWCGRDYESSGRHSTDPAADLLARAFPDSASGPVPAAGMVPPGAVRRSRHRHPAEIHQPATLRNGGLPAHRPRSVPGLQP